VLTGEPDDLLGVRHRRREGAVDEHRLSGFERGAGEVANLPVIGVFDVDHIGFLHQFRRVLRRPLEPEAFLHLLRHSGNIVPDDVRGALDDVLVLRGRILEPRGERVGAEAELPDLEHLHLLRKCGGGL